MEASVCLSSDGVSLVGQQPENEQCGSSHPEVFCRKGVLRNFAKFTGKHLCQSLFFNKVTGLRPEACNFIKKETLVQVFPVEFAKFLRTPFLTEHLRWLLLQWKVHSCNETSHDNIIRCFKEGLGAFYQGYKTEKPWSKLEAKNHINVPELKAAKFDIMTFTKMFPTAKVVYLQIDNIVAHSYLTKMGGSHNKILSNLAKETWVYLLANGITITAEYLPRFASQEADFQSRSVLDSSE